MSYGSGAIDPSEIFQTATGLVLRVGGNSLTPRGQLTPDYGVISGLLRLVQYCATGTRKIIVVPGGVGGHIFVEWARQVGCSDAFINSIGCSLIDMGAQILADHFARELANVGISCSPRAATSVEDLLLLYDTFSVVVCKSEIRGAISSDSMALLVADAVKAPVLSVKRTIPFDQGATMVKNTHPAYTHRVPLAVIEQVIARDSLIGSPGWHHSIDLWALRMLRRPGVSLSFTSADDIRQFPVTQRLSKVLKVVNETR